MVFIEKRHNFLSGLADKPKQKAFFALVSDESFQTLNNEVSETDAIYYSCIEAIKNNHKEGFNTQYSKISKRKVSHNSTAPFVHDDFLIFTLVIGVLKFDYEKEWLLSVINSRAKNAITTTFENLIKGNYQSKANIQSLILVFFYLMDKSKINNEILVEAYKAMSDINQSFNNDFIRIIHYRAFDIIIQFKLPRNTDKISRLLKFETRFKKRVKVLSFIVYNALWLFVLIVAALILDCLPEGWKSKINDIVLILALAGTGLVGNLFPKLRIMMKVILMSILGYPSQNDKEKND